MKCCLSLWLLLLMLSGCAIYTPDRLSELQKPLWVPLGVSTDGLVLDEMDKTSIKLLDKGVEFVERKTLLSAKGHRKTYQYVTWTAYCRAKTLALKSIKLFNEQHQLIEEKSYNPEMLISVIPNSPSEKQLRLACE